MFRGWTFRWRCWNNGYSASALPAGGGVDRDVVSRLPIYPTLLCGGDGTRLWPLSYQSHPKQFISLNGNLSILQSTAARVTTEEGFRGCVVVTSEESRFIAAAQLQEINTEVAALILEPAGRNTAPAVAVAAFHLARIDPGALMLVMPSDHHIEDAAAFRRAVAAGADSAQSGRLITFGITPRWSETGYGYIRPGRLNADGTLDIERFIEKPTPAAAEQYVASGDYYWNAGIFLFRCDRYLESLARERPDIHAACEAAVEGATRDLDFIRLDRSAFLNCPAESIDHAVMETADDAQVIPVDMGWSDIGSWNAVWEAGAPDKSGNVTQGDVLLQDCQRCYVRSDKKLTAAVGVADLLVVETPEALLVSHRERTNAVRAVVKRLRAEGRSEQMQPARVYRPWGYYETIHLGECYRVKHLWVSPGAQISLQMHQHRAEHWTVVSGTAAVQRGEERVTLGENQSTYIPAGVKHRLGNPSDLPLSLVEVQSGSYLGEDDIVRFKDDYNRH